MKEHLFTEDKLQAKLVNNVSSKLGSVSSAPRGKTGLVAKHKTSLLLYKVPRSFNMKIFSNKALFTLKKSFYFPLKFREKRWDASAQYRCRLDQTFTG